MVEFCLKFIGQAYIQKYWDRWQTFQVLYILCSPVGVYCKSKYCDMRKDFRDFNFSMCLRAKKW